MAQSLAREYNDDADLTSRLEELFKASIVSPCARLV